MGLRPRRSLASLFVMRALALQFSVAAALAILFFQLSADASVEHALVTAAVAAGASFLTLTSVGTVIQRARRVQPPRSRADSTP